MIGTVRRCWTNQPSSNTPRTRSRSLSGTSPRRGRTRRRRADRSPRPHHGRAAGAPGRTQPRPPAVLVVHDSPQPVAVGKGDPERVEPGGVDDGDHWDCPSRRGGWSRDADPRMHCAATASAGWDPAVGTAMDRQRGGLHEATWARFGRLLAARDPENGDRRTKEDVCPGPATRRQTSSRASFSPSAVLARMSVPEHHAAGEETDADEHHPETGRPAWEDDTEKEHAEPDDCCNE